MPKFISNFINKIFKRNNKNKEVVSYYEIPNRNNLSEDKIELLNSYKEEYLSKLKSNKYLLDISKKELFGDYIIYQQLLLNHLLRNSTINKIDNNDLYYNLKIEMLKMYILYTKISDIYDEMVLRLIALNEIRKEKLLLPKKKRLISNEMDSFISSIVVNRTSLYSASMRTKLCMTRFNNILNNSICDEYMINITIQKNKKEVFNDARIYIPEVLDDVSDSTMEDIGIIAYLEIELEKYVFNHKDDVNLIIKELDDIKQFDYNKKNKDGLLKQIESIETKYYFYYKYGRNIITKETFNDLYETKFKILTCDIGSLEETLINESDRGYEYYKQIVERKYNDIINGNNEIFNNIFGEKNEAITNFKKIPNVMIECDWYENERLKLILAFDRENGFSEMLSNARVKSNYFINMSNDPHVMNNESLLKLSTYVSLKTIYELTYLGFGLVKGYNPQYRLYKIMRDREEKLGLNKEYILPDGIEELQFNNNIFNMSKLRRILKDKALILPGSLRKIENYDKLRLLSSNKTNDIIIFDDYENSWILKSRYKLSELLMPYISKELTKSRQAYYYCCNMSLAIKEQDTIRLIYKNRTPFYPEDFHYTMDTIISNLINNGECDRVMLQNVNKNKLRKLVR